MPTVFSIQIQDATLAIWHITESDQELEGKLLGDEISSFNAFKSCSRRKEFAASRALVHEICGEHEIVNNSLGAPEFKAHDKHLSISHNGSYAACVVSMKSNCALDIEFFSRSVERVKHKFLSPKEQQILIQESNFILAWCAKEVAYKFLQRENVDFIDDLPVTEFNPEAKIIKISAFSHQILSINYMFFQELLIAYII